MMSSEAFALVIGDFYMTNPIARSSAVMAGLSQLRAVHGQKLSAAE
jgi:NADH-quinone oxidoreductase subunit G